MKNPVLKKTFTLAAVLTAITVAVRLVLQFVLIDHDTGFYMATGAGRAAQLVFNLLLVVSAVLIWLSVRRTGGQFADERKSFNREFFIALMVMGISAELSYLSPFLIEFRSLFSGHGVYLPSFLPAVIFVIGGVLLLYQGLLGFSGKEEDIDLGSAAILSLWGAAALVCTYLSHTIVYHVSDNMLHVLAVAALAFFLTNLLKYMMGTACAQSGRRAVLYALLTAYFGATLVIPRLASMPFHGGNEVLGAPRFYPMLFVLVCAATAVIAAWCIAFGETKTAEAPEQPEAEAESTEE